MTIADDLPEIASIGPFFDVTTHEESSAGLTPWRLMSELITLPQHLAGRVDRVRAALVAQASHRPVATSNSGSPPR